MSFELRDVAPDDLDLIVAWMNDPDVDRYWELAGHASRTTDHLAEVAASEHSASYVGLLDGVPMSYWELYRADLDPLALHYAAEPYDGGIHLLIGPPEYRGRGLGAPLLETVATRMLDEDERMSRVLAEPDVRNTASIRSFERAGFVRTADVDLPEKRAALMELRRTYDVVGVGIGPFNLALAALADDVPELATRFFDDRPAWSWHPGLLFEDAELQVPFLADLVTLVDPTSRWSFLNYLRHRDRLFPFYFSERFHVPRREYDDYCRWVASGLDACRFGRRVTAVEWDGGLFTVRADGLETRTRNVVLGIGTEPHVPTCFQGTAARPAAGYLAYREEIQARRDITVIGSGQTGAEVFLDLLRAQPEHGARLRWLTRSPAFAPMEYSKLGLEHFTPDYTRYFQGLPAETRKRLVPGQWQLYKAISADTIAAIFDLLYERSVAGERPDVELMPNVEVVEATEAGDHLGDLGDLVLRCRHREQDREFTVETGAVVLATGFRTRRPDCLDPLKPYLDLDDDGELRIDENYRVATSPEVAGGLYVQNAELHTHGVGAPDLGLGAHRAAVILNSIAAREVHPLPSRTAFTTFGVNRC